MALAASAVWGFGISKPVFLHPHVVLAFFLTFHKATLGIICWMMKRPGPLGLPVPNIAFRNVKKAKTTVGTETQRLRNAKSASYWLKEEAVRPDGAASAKRCFLECQKESQNYGRDVETQVSGRLGLQCLTLLSGMSRKKPELRWEWKNTGFETPHPHAAEGRGGPAGWGCQCLTLLSGISRIVKLKKVGDGETKASKRHIPILLKDEAARSAKAASA